MSGIYTTKRQTMSVLPAFDQMDKQGPGPRIRTELTRPHVLLHIEPLGRLDSAAWHRLTRRIEQPLRRIAPGAIYETSARCARILISLNGFGSTEEQVGRIDRAIAEAASDDDIVVGRSLVGVAPADARRGLQEASDAAMTARVLMGGGALSYGELGVYTYLMRLAQEELPRDRYTQAVERLVAYDARRRAELVHTLEQYLEHGCRIARTARSLHIHANTLRQRLERIEELAEFELASADLLALELAIKLRRLKAAIDSYERINGASPPARSSRGARPGRSAPPSEAARRSKRTSGTWPDHGLAHGRSGA
jgi:PucR C-terminal helix-turn-helix domain/GGDEF-like domain